MLGIIGGNGVAATNRLLQLIEGEIVRGGAYRDCHHPEMIVWQATQAPSRSLYLEGRGESFLPDYLSIGRKLKDCGCDMLCMCCNTAHFFIDELEEGIKLPFINIIKETVDTACSNYSHHLKIGVMCSDGCARNRLYDRYIDGKDIEIVYPDEEHQILVTKGICSAKSANRFFSLEKEDSPVSCFCRAAEYLNRIGCDVIIAGCTDINNVFYPGENFGSSIYVDSLVVTARTIIRDILNDN